MCSKQLFSSLCLVFTQDIIQTSIKIEGDYFVRFNLTFSGKKTKVVICNISFGWCRQNLGFKDEQYHTWNEDSFSTGCLNTEDLFDFDYCNDTICDKGYNIHYIIQKWWENDIQFLNLWKIEKWVPNLQIKKKAYFPLKKWTIFLQHKNLLFDFLNSPICLQVHYLFH